MDWHLITQESSGFIRGECQKDVKDSKEKIVEEPVYYSLNLIRFLLYVKNNRIYSKIEGGKIALEQFPAIYKNLIFRIIESFEVDVEKIDVDPYELKLFASYMLEEIDKEIKIKASLEFDRNSLQL